MHCAVSGITTQSRTYHLGLKMTVDYHRVYRGFRTSQRNITEVFPYSVVAVVPRRRGAVTLPGCLQLAVHWLRVSAVIADFNMGGYYYALTHGVHSNDSNPC